MEMIINLIIQLVAGVVGGNAAGAALKDYNLGGIGNTIAGALGGVGGGQLLQAAIPAIAARGWRQPRRQGHSLVKLSAVVPVARSSRSSSGW